MPNSRARPLSTASEAMCALLHSREGLSVYNKTGAHRLKVLSALLGAKRGKLKTNLSLSFNFKRTMPL
jgi:hypothetical protein